MCFKFVFIVPIFLNIACDDSIINPANSSTESPAGTQTQATSQTQQNTASQKGTRSHSSTQSQTSSQTHTGTQSQTGSQTHTGSQVSVKNVVEEFKSVGITVPIELEEDFIILDTPKAELLDIAAKKLLALKAQQPNAKLWAAKDLLDIAKMQLFGDGDQDEIRKTIYLASENNSAQVINYLKEMKKKSASIIKNHPDISKANHKNVNQYTKYGAFKYDFSNTLGSMEGYAEIWFSFHSKDFNI